MRPANQATADSRRDSGPGSKPGVESPCCTRATSSMNHDPRFGPVAMVGLGGVLTETLRDVAFALAPVPARRAEELLRGLRSAALLAGVRGRPAVDVAAAAAVIERITTVAAAHPEIAELEVNPLLVRPDGALALDARAVLG